MMEHTIRKILACRETGLAVTIEARLPIGDDQNLMASGSIRLEISGVDPPVSWRAPALDSFLALEILLTNIRACLREHGSTLEANPGTLGSLGLEKYHPNWKLDLLVAHLTNLEIQSENQLHMLLRARHHDEPEHQEDTALRAEAEATRFNIAREIVTGQGRESSLESYNREAKLHQPEELPSRLPLDVVFPPGGCIASGNAFNPQKTITAKVWKPVLEPLQGQSRWICGYEISGAGDRIVSAARGEDAFDSLNQATIEIRAYLRGVGVPDDWVYAARTRHEQIAAAHLARELSRIQILMAWARGEEASARQEDCLLQDSKNLEWERFTNLKCVFEKYLARKEG